MKDQPGQTGDKHEKEPLVTIPNVPIPQIQTSWRSGDFTLDRMIWLIPQAKMLVVAGKGATELHLIKVDVEELLDESDLDYLLITSRPPPTVDSDSTFRYQIQVKSRQGGTSFSWNPDRTGCRSATTERSRGTYPAKRRGCWNPSSWP